MVTVQNFIQALSEEALPAPGTVAPAFPQDLASWVSSESLLNVAQEAAERSSGTPLLALLGGFGFPTPQDDLLVLVAYCYLRGIYHSIDVVQQLDSDENLETMRPRFGLRPEQVRQFRREHRSSLADGLTCALFQLWRQRFAHLSGEFFTDSLVRNRHNFGLLEPFYRHARERLDRAIALDSMALDD